jgi:NTP pyrophosphatase (non-canonical NTP hydrolase)
MDFTDYQRAAAQTAGEFSEDRWEKAAWSMGLAGESGELVDLIKKELFHNVTASRRNVESEAGDVLWYLANLCYIYGIDLQRVAENNLAKLRARYPNGFASGGGVREVAEACDQVYSHGPAEWIKCGEHSIALGHVWLCPNHYRETKVGKD